MIIVPRYPGIHNETLSNKKRKGERGRKKGEESKKERKERKGKSMLKLSLLNIMLDQI